MTRLVKTRENINYLPNGFTEVEYLQSSGTEWIDTGVTINTATDEVEMYFQLISTTKYQWLMGEHDNGARFGIGVGDGTNLRNIAYGATTYKVNDTQVYNNMHKFVANSNGVYLDGVQVHAFESFSSTSTIYLFNLNISGGAGLASGKIWTYRHKRNGALIRDLIPCLDNNGTPCMWDTITKKPYRNQGNGTFTYGREIHYVEYLQSDGNQYIDIGIKYKPSLSIKGKLTRTEMGASGSVMLLSTSTTNPVLYFPALNANSKQDRYVWRRNGYSEQSYYYYFDDYPVTEEVYLDAINDKLYLNGSLVKSGMIAGMNGYSSPYESASNLYLYGIGNTYRGVGKIYYCQIWDNTELVRDYLPARDENNVSFMFDRVSRTCYFNSGTGSFTYGNPAYTTKTRLIKDIVSKIPTGLTRVEYLEGTGTQYINTGLASTENSKVDTTFSFSTMDSGATNNCAIFGGRSSSTYTTNTFTMFKLASGSPQYFRFDYNGQVNVANASQLTWNTNSKYRFTYNGTTRTVENVTTGEKVTASLSPATSYTTQPICLFAVNTMGTVGQFMKGRIYHYWYTDGTNSIDLVPVIDKDNRPCMYDMVSGQLFYNQGTGTFGYGREIHNVEYLESTGTQYINTGYAFQDDFSWEIDFEGISDGCTLFGGRTSSTRTALLYQRNYGGIDKTTCPIAGYNGQETPFQLDDLRIGRHKIKMAVASNKGSVWVDGSQVYNKEAFTGTYISGTTQALFADNFGTSVSEYTSSKVYNLKMWQGSNLVRDFIPCIDENNVGFMLDKVSNTVYDNAGSGTFTTGGIIPSTKTRLVHSWLDDYTFVNYIQSTGTQYINTGVTLTNNHSVEIDYQLTQASQSRAGLFGNLNMTGSNQGRFGSLLSPSNQQLEHGYGTGNDYWQQGSPDTNRHKLYQKKNEIYFDGTLIHTFTPATFTLDTTAPLGSFGYTNYTPAKAKYYNSKWWNGDTLIRNFIPAIRKSDSAVGMLDIVNRVFYTNQGTGVFSYG